MYTGLISEVGSVLAIEKSASLARIKIGASFAEPIAIGASVACSGPCMTVTEKGASPTPWFAVEASPETLARANIGDWEEGSPVNLERPLRAEDELGGHFVTGHIDGTCLVRAITREGESHRVYLEAPEDSMRFIAPKGSVALDGISLTVNGADGKHFDVLVIPHTFRHTSWYNLKQGARVNLEVDLLARHLDRLLQAQTQARDAP